MIYFIIILAIIARFIPHMPNFASITALAIFSAATLDWKKAAGLTLAARFISDLFLGFFSWPLMLAVYASHLAGILFGVWIRTSLNPSSARREMGPSLSFFKERQGEVIKWIKIVGSSIAASMLFFFVTNFAFFYSEYPHNISGIILAYMNGLPFLRGTMAGDLGYTAALFGVYEIVGYIVRAKSRTNLNFGFWASSKTKI